MVRIKSDSNLFLRLLAGGGSDKTYYEDYKMTWISMIKQKMPVVCFRAGSDEIVGVNMLFVVSKEDNFMVETYKHVNIAIFVQCMEVMDLEFIL